ncbi:MAG: hypothetical protein H0W90_08005 [Actinobacteria bacterium]|nr:hypothetical protein [Actinomycetota bacterium]
MGRALFVAESYDGGEQLVFGIELVDRELRVVPLLPLFFSGQPRSRNAIAQNGALALA